MSLTPGHRHPGRVPPLTAGDVEGLVADRFDQVVRLQPDAVAVKARDEVVTYGALAQWANGIAAALSPHVIAGGGTVVAFVDALAPSTIASMLGVMKVGAICAPQDASHPPAYLSSVIDDAGATIVLVDTRTRRFVESLHPRRLVIDVDRVERGDGAAARVSPEAPAFLCYTSGSTGRPKGIVHSNRNLLHRSFVQTERLGFNESDRHALMTSVATGTGASTVFRVLLSGGTLLLRAPGETGLDALVEWLRSERVSVYRSTPTLFRTLLRLLPGEFAFPDLRAVLLGGERVTGADVLACRSRVSSGCVFVNAYSASETSNVTMFVTDCQSDLPPGELPVGYPVPGMRVSVLDNDGGVCGPGEEGGVAVVSRYVALGYWRDPDRTAACFRDAGEGERMYTTGDRGVMQSDGCLHLLGRSDARVKVRGQRIELEEIEQVLTSHTDVRAAAVTEETAPDGSIRLVACVVPHRTTMPPASVLRAFLIEQLPAAKVPSAYVAVQALPLTASGKLDRRALPALLAGVMRPSAEAAVNTATERTVATLWAEVLGTAPSSVDEDFMAVGGDSLAAARLLARVTARWGVTISFTEFIDASSVAQLALAIDRANNQHTDY